MTSTLWTPLTVHYRTSSLLADVLSAYFTGSYQEHSAAQRPRETIKILAHLSLSAPAEFPFLCLSIPKSFLVCGLAAAQRWDGAATFWSRVFRGVGGWTVHVVSRRTSALSLVERWIWSGSGSLKKHVLYNLCGSEARLHLWNVFLRNGSEVKPSHNSHSRWTKTTVIH